MQGTPSFLSLSVRVTRSFWKSPISVSSFSTWVSTPLPTPFKNSGIPTFTVTLTHKQSQCSSKHHTHAHEPSKKKKKKKGIHLCRELIWTKSLQSQATKLMVIFYSTIRFASMPSSNLWQLNLHINLYCKLIWSVVQCVSLMRFLRNTHFIIVNGQEYNIFSIVTCKIWYIDFEPKKKWAS